MIGEIDPQAGASRPSGFRLQKRGAGGWVRLPRPASKHTPAGACIGSVAHRPGRCRSSGYLCRLASSVVAAGTADFAPAASAHLAPGDFGLRPGTRGRRAISKEGRRWTNNLWSSIRVVSSFMQAAWPVPSRQLHATLLYFPKSMAKIRRAVAALVVVAALISEVCH